MYMVYFDHDLALKASNLNDEDLENENKLLDEDATLQRFIWALEVKQERNRREYNKSVCQLEEEYSKLSRWQKLKRFMFN